MLLDIYDDKLLSFNYSLALSNANLGIGCVPSACVTVSIKNTPVVINQEIQILNYGTFFITELDNNSDSNVSTFTAYDIMYSQGSVAYTPTIAPTTSVYNVLLDLFSQWDVLHTAIPSEAQNIMVNASIEGFSRREMLSQMLGLLGYNAFVNKNNAVQFVKYSDCSTVLSPDNYYQGKFSCNANNPLAQISCTLSDENVISKSVSRETGYNVNFNNQFMTDDILQNIADNLAAFWNDRPFVIGSVEVCGSLNLNVGDVLIITDVNNNSYLLPVSIINVSYDGGFITKLQNISDSSSNCENWSGGISGNLSTVKADVAQFKQLTVVDDDGVTKISGSRVETKSLYAQQINIQAKTDTKTFQILSDDSKIQMSAIGETSSNQSNLTMLDDSVQLSALQLSFAVDNIDFNSASLYNLFSDFKNFVSLNEIPQSANFKKLSSCCFVSFNGQADITRTLGNMLFTLPMGFRPSLNVDVPFVIDTSAFGIVRIATDGIAQIVGLSKNSTGAVTFQTFFFI